MSDISRRGFMQLLGLSAAAVFVPTSLLPSFTKLKHSDWPKRRKARALSGHARPEKFKVFVTSVEGKMFEVRGTPVVKESDGLLLVSFADWHATQTIAFKEMTVVDDDGFVLLVKSKTCVLNSGDMLKLSYHVTT